MLAYVFWHWRSPEVERAAYADALLEFHRVLAAHRPQGFLGSVVFRTRDAPWAPTNLEVYEDWYLVTGSAALDPLNEAAVSGPRKTPHDAVARWAAGGSGGLYRLRSGGEGVTDATTATWFSKPADTGYDDFFRALRPWTARPGATLWQRQMTLGPATEFCLLAPAPLDSPPGAGAVMLRVERIWAEVSAFQKR
ncbi:MAG: hypothetical protein HY660_08570 [Armatimonadetes bacterium]|nr:hypothetical protein [Armatimonadota bacterium]